MNRFKTVATILIGIVIFLTLGLNVAAQYGQYGAPPSLSIIINKLVSMPGNSNNFVDNLSASDPRFVPGQELFFKLMVQNTSSVTLTNVTVKDFVPNYLDPIEGPGTFDSTTRIISFNAGDFAPNEEKTYILKMRVQNQNQLPADKGLFCLINRSQASNDKVFDEDTAQFCLEKQVTAPNVPSAGPEFAPLLLTLNLIGVGAGLYLKKIIK